MKTKTASVAGIVGALVLLAGGALWGADLTLGDYTYTTNAAGQATITGFNKNYTGALPITNTLGGCPVTSIGGMSVFPGRSSAFSGCTGLTNITIPAGVTSIGKYAFHGCTHLQAITVDAANTNYSSLNGVLLNKSQTMLIQCPEGKVGSYVIPGSVTSIGSAAFSGCTGLTNITIPANLTNFGFEAFANCPNLPAAIQNLAPKQTPVRRRVPFPQRNDGGSNSAPPLSGEALQKYLQQYNMELIRARGEKGPPLPIQLTPEMDTQLVKEGVLPPLENQASESDTSNRLAPPGAVQPARSVILGVIRPRALPPATSLTLGDYTYTTNAAGQATITGFNKNYVGALAITNSLGGCPVNGIGYHAFWGCTGLTSVTIPASVTSIGEHAFNGCPSLTEILVNTNNPAYSSVDGVLFNKSQTTLIQFPGSKAGTYTIPTSVTSIGSGPPGVRIPFLSVGDGPFSGCTGLVRVTIPASVTCIVRATFSRCTGLTSVTIPDGVASIDDQAFYNCIGLTNVTIPASVTSIGYEAFYGCTSLTSVTIPASVTSIRQQAFAGCTGLTNLIIPASVTNFGYDAFQGCTNLPPAIQNLAPKRPPVISGVIRAPASLPPGSPAVPGVATPPTVSTNPATPASPVPPIPAISLASTNVLEIPAASDAVADFLKLTIETATKLGVLSFWRRPEPERQVDSHVELVIHYKCESGSSSALSEFAETMHKLGAGVTSERIETIANGHPMAELAFIFSYRRIGTPPAALPAAPPPPPPIQPVEKDHP